MNKLQAIKQAHDHTYKLREEMWASLLVIFPDFYWSRPRRPYMNLNEGVLDFPESRRVQPDRVITPERAASLRELGFKEVYVGAAGGDYLYLTVCRYVEDTVVSDALGDQVIAE